MMDAMLQYDGMIISKEECLMMMFGSSSDIEA